VPVPSLRRPTLVEDFAARLAQGLGLPFKGALQHVHLHPSQTEMRNSFQQASNVTSRFSVSTPLNGEAILLIDDIADSKWTMTILGDLLQRHGSGPVCPFALAVTNTSD
jgi:ATP-dependent DNA helicase RecQ